MIALLSLALAQVPSATDLELLSWLGQPSLSPDGRRLAFVEARKAFDPQADLKGDTVGGWTVTTVLLELELKSGAVRELTWGEGVSVSDPRWSPDGSWLAYQREADDEGGIALLPAGGGEPRELDTGELEPHSWDWIAPDRIAFTAVPEPSDEEVRAAFRVGGAYEHASQYENARLYTVDLVGGDPVELTDGSDHIAEWRHAAGAWLLKVGPSSDPYRVWTEGSVQLLADGERTVLEPDPKCTGPLSWSPAGTRAAWAVCDGTLSYPNKVAVLERATGAVRSALPDADRYVNELVWEDERSLLVQVSERLETRLYRLDPSRSTLKDLGWSGGLLGGTPISAPRGWITRSLTPERAHHLVRIDARGRTEVLYEANPQVAEWPLGETLAFPWAGPEDTALEGLVIRPPGASGPTPLLVMPHGGPDGVSTRGFDLWARFFAARGYTVFRPNYRGGIAYGVAFYAANRGRLGEIELADIESGVDALIAAGLVDPERLFYGGWSWGGYLTTWTIAHTDRYKAAMAGAAVVDTVNQYVTSDINHGEIAAWEYTALPWTGLEHYDRADPSRVLGNIHTPTLVLHGDADTRVPFAQGLTLYRALQDQGIESELWVYPDEDHGLREPAHNVHRLEAWAEWMSRHSD